MTVHVRTATVHDAPAIAQVQVASWQWAYCGHLPDEILDELDVAEREAVWLGVLASDDDRHRVFVGEGAAGVIGFASIGGPATMTRSTARGSCMRRSWP